MIYRIATVAMAAAMMKKTRGQDALMMFPVELATPNQRSTAVVVLISRDYTAF